jgi:hypothetical protein
MRKSGNAVVGVEGKPLFTVLIRWCGIITSGLRHSCSDALEALLGFGRAPLGLVEQRQVVEVNGDIGMVRAKPLLTDGKGVLVERFGFSIADLTLISISHTSTY